MSAKTVGLAAIVAAALFVAVGSSVARASPAARTIVLPDGADTLIVPADAPVRYRSTEKDWPAVHFTGQFVLTGEFHFSCNCDEEGDRTFQLYVVPDPDDLARLPHWRIRASDRSIGILHDRRLVRAVIPARQLALVRSGKLEEVTGRLSVVVKNYTAEIECDGPVYSVTFVALAKPVRLAATSGPTTQSC